MAIKIGDIIKYKTYGIGKERFGEVVRIIKVEASYAEQEVGRVNYTVEGLNRGELEGTEEIGEADVKKVYM